MDFYEVNQGYNLYLQNYELGGRGFTRVPNLKYKLHNKFACGVVLKIGSIKYYVALSSFKIKQEANILIRVPGDKVEIKGSLRFNYMFPIPDDCVKKIEIKNILDKKYKRLLVKEYRFCVEHEEQIKAKAKQIYAKVISNSDSTLTNNSCDFKLLEKAYTEYIKKEGH